MLKDLGPGAIVGWLRDHGTIDSLAGCAFLVGPDIVLTCAHVVGAHLGLSSPLPPEPPTSMITIRFESMQTEVVGSVLPGGWFSNIRSSYSGISDLAVIRLNGPVFGISLPTIARRMPTLSSPVLIHGAENNYRSYGQQILGRMSGSNIPRGWRQIDPADSQRGFVVRNGFSGAPVLDELGNIIWGMIVAVAEHSTAVAYAIPSEWLWAALESVGTDHTVHSSSAIDTESARKMSDVLNDIRNKRLDIARIKLQELEGNSCLLHDNLRIRIIYDRACLESLCAEDFPRDSVDRKRALDESLEFLTKWLAMGFDGTWERDGRTAQNEIYRMGCDGDLHCLLSERKDAILERLPHRYRDALPREIPRKSISSGGGCVIGDAPITTTAGIVPISTIREGDEIVSMKIGRDSCLITSRVAELHRTKESKMVLINKVMLMSMGHHVYLSTLDVISAENIKVGMMLYGYNMEEICVTSIDVVNNNCDVYNITTNHNSHNYFAYGILCHNKMYVKY